MSSEKSLLNLLEQNILENSNIRISTKKISLRAFYRLIDIFNKAKSIRILLNDFDDYRNIENEIIRTYEIDRKENELLTNEFEMKLKNDLMDFYYAKEVRDFIKNKIEIKYIKKYNNNFISIDSNNYVITNVVEISMSTLGEIESDEDLIIDEDYSKVKYSKYTLNFDQAWNSIERSKDIKEKILDKLNLIYKEKSPSDLYYFSLSKLLSKKTNNIENKYEESNREEFEKTKIYKSLYNFQVHAVEAIIEKINKYNGCILADSVGLGKTYEALAVIKYFELQGKKVLVLCPKKLKSNWANFKYNLLMNELKEDNFNYTILTHTDLSREKGNSGDIELSKFDWSNFDLLVIDESHNFRNGKFNENTEKWRSKRYDKLMKETILKGRKTAVLLLSATPINNRMEDINNQIKLITKNDDFAFKNESIKSIEKICRQAEKKSNEWSELPEKERTVEMFQKMVGNNFKKLIDLITIARSRKQIKENYLNDSLNFPNRLKPISKRPNIDTLNKVGNIKDLNNQISNINFAFYKPINYVRPEFMSEYEDEYDWRVANTNSRLSHKNRENSLINLLRINILKRFESSIESFKITMKKILENTRNVFETLDKNVVLNTNIDDLYDDEIELQEELDFKKIKVKIEHIDLIKYKYELNEDIVKIEKILSDFDQITYKRDEKLKQLIEIIESKITNPLNNGNKKVIVFTTFADTAKYLYNHISSYFEREEIYSLLVTGTEIKTNNIKIKKIKDLGNNNIDEGLSYFSPKSKKMQNLSKEEEIDILIATDCISEGQNLQDCDYLINYDIHWNPVRLIQRFGRIDRIGSENKNIQMVNFWPNINMEEYIRLETRVKAKMQKVVQASAADENVLNSLSYEENNKLNQLNAIEKQPIDLEEIRGNVSFSSLTYSEFETDLKIYSMSKEKELKKQSEGIFSIASSDEISEEGIIFLFKSLNLKNPNNRYDPYYLVYIKNNGEILYSYSDISKILNLYKRIGNSQREVNKSLFEKFNKETNFGKNMKQYVELLNKSIASIENKKDDEDLDSLFNPEATLNKNDLNDYVLISFLIIDKG